MAVVDVKSTQYKNREQNPPVANDPQDIGGKLRFYRFDFDQGSVAGDATSKQYLCRIPAGKGYIIPALSRLKRSAFGAARTLDMGHEGWTEPDGDAVAAAGDVLIDGLDVSAAGAAAMGTGTNGETDAIAYNAVDEIVISSTVAGGTIPASATLKGFIAVISQH
jgi:hypothetical protein